jgi:predicted transcriptional regulator
MTVIMMMMTAPTSRRFIRQPHRDYYEIIKQILHTVYSKVGGCKSAEIAYRCELAWFQFMNYRDILVSHKLLISSHIGPTGRYEITPKGVRFLEVFAEIENDLKSADIQNEAPDLTNTKSVRLDISEPASLYQLPGVEPIFPVVKKLDERMNLGRLLNKADNVFDSCSLKPGSILDLRK